MKPAKRQHDCTSSSEEDFSYKKLKTAHKKPRKRRHSTSSSSDTSYTSSSSSSSSSDDCSARKRRSKSKKSKKKKISYKTKSKKDKKDKTKKRKASKEKKSLKKTEKSDASRKNKSSESVDTPSNDIPLHLMDKSMAPMTREQWEKQQSVVRKVFDESTGRYRLIKGDGEVLEEIVSRDRHKQINQAATRGDGEYFQSNLKQLNIRK